MWVTTLVLYKGINIQGRLELYLVKIDQIRPIFFRILQIIFRIFQIPFKIFQILYRIFISKWYQKFPRKYTNG